MTGGACEACGAALPPIAGRGRPRVYCSAECGRLARAVAEVEQAVEAWRDAGRATRAGRHLRATIVGAANRIPVPRDARGRWRR